MQGTSKKLARNAKNLQRTSEKIAQAITRNHQHHIAFFAATATATKAETYNRGGGGVRAARRIRVYLLTYVLICSYICLFPAILKWSYRALKTALWIPTPSVPPGMCPMVTPVSKFLPMIPRMVELFDFQEFEFTSFEIPNRRLGFQSSMIDFRFHDFRFCFLLRSCDCTDSSVPPKCLFSDIRLIECTIDELPIFRTTAY